MSRYDEVEEVTKSEQNVSNENYTKAMKTNPETHRSFRYDHYRGGRGVG